MNTPNHDDTVRFVPASQLVQIARLGLAMRKAQRAYFDKRKKYPNVPADTEWRAVRKAEERFDGAVKDALQHEQGPLPGMS